MRFDRVVVVVLAMAMWPAVAWAQVDELGARCAAAGEAAPFCRLTVQAVDAGLPRFGVALAGGNPVPGTASTLGFRLENVPRATVGVRFTMLRARMPPIRDQDRVDEDRYFLPSVNVDGGIAAFPGFTLLPTVGGVASLDFLASAGLIVARSGPDLNRRPPSVGLGLRFGLLRESFHFPGVSVTGMYRRLGSVTVGDGSLQERDAFFSLSAPSVLGIRAAASKRIVAVNVTAGIGRDRYRSDVRLGVRGPQQPGPTFTTEFSGFTARRTVAFANASWTTLILHLVGEVGWQSGGERVPGELPVQARFSPTRGALFGSVAARLSI